MTEEEMHFKKYKSNGDIPEIMQHSCICCKKTKNDTEIFIFTDNSIGHGEWVASSQLSHSYTTTPPSTGSITGPSTYQPSTYPISIFGGQNPAYRPAKKNTIFLCAECLYKLAQKISEETIAKIVADKI